MKEQRRPRRMYTSGSGVAHGSWVLVVWLQPRPPGDPLDTAFVSYDHQHACAWVRGRVGVVKLQKVQREEIQTGL